MADFNKPVITDNYSTVFAPVIVENFKSLALGLEPASLTAASLTVTNIPTNTLRWELVTNKRLEKYNGASWVTAEPAGGFNFSITGSAATWTTGRTIALTGDVTGTSAAFNGSANLSFATTLATVAATKGGTGQTSYAVGDILYANTTTTLAKLADIATGNALISGGVGVAPSWGKVGLTTHISGTLAVGNGGTGATTFTSGGLLVGNGASAVGIATPAQIVAAIGATAVTNATNATSATSATSATNITGGAAGEVLYQSAAGTTAKLAAGTSGYVLTSSGAGAAPTWQPAGTATLATNISGGSAGDLLYQSAANTTAKLADVATGNALISGGVGLAPSYGKIGLTTHISGTLAVGNGGTGATTFTSGGILVGNGASAIGVASGAQIVAAIGASAVTNATNATNATTAAACSGNAATVTNGVYTTGDQSIAGVKTFTGTSLNISGVSGSYTGTVYLGSRHQRNVTATNLWEMVNAANTTVIFSFDNSGNFTATANVTAYSDERVKKNWRGLGDDFIEKLAGLKSGIYDRTDMKQTQVGVGAQSLREFLPEAVLEDADGKLSVSYGNAALAACVRLAAEVVNLRAEIGAMKK